MPRCISVCSAVRTQFPKHCHVNNQPTNQPWSYINHGVPIKTANLPSAYLVHAPPHDMLSSPTDSSKQTPFTRTFSIKYICNSNHRKLNPYDQLIMVHMLYKPRSTITSLLALPILFSFLLFHHTQIYPIHSLLCSA